MKEVLEPYTFTLICESMCLFASQSVSQCLEVGKVRGTGKERNGGTGRNGACKVVRGEGDP